MQESAAAEKSRRFYRPELDLLRLLAFLMVYVHHTVSSGFSKVLPPLWIFAQACGAGMQIFFVLSSYLITELLLREREKTNTVDIRAFFTRRILRIWPLYFCFLGGYWILTHVTRVERFETTGYLAFLLLAGNWYIEAGDTCPNSVVSLWSISLEEQFYLIWPFVGRFFGRRGLWVVSVTTFLGAYLALFLLAPHRVHVESLWYNTFIEFQFFAIGAMLALVLHHRTFVPAGWLRLLLFALAFVAIGLTQSGLGTGSVTRFYLLIGVGVCALFLAIRQIAVAASWGPLLYLGKISYGLYVFHWGAMNIVSTLAWHAGLRWTASALARMVGGLLLTVLFAMISYRVLELPFLRLKRRFTLVRTRDD